MNVVPNLVLRLSVTISQMYVPILDLRLFFKVKTKQKEFQKKKN